MNRLLVTLGWLMLPLLGCGSKADRERIQELEDKIKSLEAGQTPQPPKLHWFNSWVDGITEELIFRTIGLTCIALGALSLPVAIVLLVMGLRWLAKIFVSCGPLIAAVGIALVWAANNITWVQVVVLVPCAVVGAWAVWVKLVPRIERILNLDLNRDGKLGP